jgi:acyl carrier protein
MTNEEITAKLTSIITEEFGVPAVEVTTDATFEALGLDSLDLVELTMILDEQVGVKLEDEDLESIETVQQAIDAIAAKISVTA